MKLIRSAKKKKKNQNKEKKIKITKDEIGENLTHLENTEIVLVHCNIANNEYQQDSRVLYTFVPNKSFGSLLEISPKTQVFLKTFNIFGLQTKIVSHQKQKIE